MLVNRSMPAVTIIPVLVYPDLPAAIAWLCQALGFSERLRIGNHRAQLSFGTGATVVVQSEPPSRSASSEPAAQTSSIMVRVEDVDAHYARAQQYGARIGHSPTSFPYGERQYTAVDPAGHVWTFSQSVRMSIRRRGVARSSETLARRPSMEHP
jgi:uncharacterized glyoxalase superfamily protein PhnB